MTQETIALVIILVCFVLMAGFFVIACLMESKGKVERFLDRVFGGRDE